MGAIMKLQSQALQAVTTLVLAIVVMMVLGAAALAEDIEVTVDEASLVRLERPGTEVIIGNPSVADVSVQSSRLLVVTGKSFGVTNVIVLDAQGRELLHKKVRVVSDPGRVVRLYKGKERQSFDCASRCEAALMPGDQETFFEPLAKEIRNKLGIAQQSLDGSQPAQ